MSENNKADITDPLLLPEDVSLIPVAELAANVREQFECSEDDVAITRARSRTPSKVIDAGTAKLVAYFREPMTLVEAILHYCLAIKSRPQDILPAVFPVIQDLVNARILCAEDSPEAAEIETTFTPGDEVMGLRIVSNLRTVADTELYQARKGGQPVALKIARQADDKYAAFTLERERMLLATLQGTISPSLLESGEYEGRPYLLIDWFFGVSVKAAADEYRLQNTATARHDLLALLCKVVRAYTQLHAKNVLHIDVHPDNILVDADGQVKLIDFGISTIYDPTNPQHEPQRGGIGFFYSAEYADSLRQKKLQPVSPQAEQYALATVLYYLVTGTHYLNFSLERERMLAQITDDPPLSFAEQQLTAWPELEAVLQRALAKQSAQRFADLSAFAQALETVLAECLPVSQSAPMPADAGNKLLDATLKQLSVHGELWKNGLPRAPYASLNYGMAGIAWFYYRLANLQQNPEHLHTADLWITHASTLLDDEQAFYNPEIEIDAEQVGVISPYHTASGVHALQALISQARGDNFSLQLALHAFVTCAAQPCDTLDPILGKGSVLIVGAILIENCGAEYTMPLIELGDQITEEIVARLAQNDEINRDNVLPTLGVAHGWAGLLYAVLRWTQVRQATPPTVVIERLQQLAACAEVSGRGLRWAWRLDNAQAGHMPGWCNGSAGYVFLWRLAAKFYPEQNYQQLAENTAWNVWEDPALATNLCCGLAGRAYALLHWAKHSDQPLWRTRAEHLAERAIQHMQAQQVAEYEGYEHSLYKGQLGIALLLAELKTPQWSALPLFESELT